MPSKSVKACFKCDKPFKGFRFKHHCSYCGLVFCAYCIRKNVFVGTDIELQKSCQACIDSVTRNLVETPAMEELAAESCPDIKQLDQSSSFVVISELSSSKAADKVTVLQKKLNEQTSEGWELVAATCFSQRIRNLVHSIQVPEEWVDLIESVVKQAVHSVCPSVHYRKDKMNINEYIRIVKVQSETSRNAQYFNGVLLKKNAAHKKMRCSGSPPSILFIRGGTEYSDGETNVVSIEKLVNQEAHFTDFLVRKIEQLEVQVVVNESTFSQLVINYLAEKNILAFIKVKLKHLRLIARSTQGQVLESIDRTSNTMNFLGNCEKLQHYREYGVYCFENPMDSTLAGSILITGPNLDELKKVRQLLKQLIVEYRGLLLEKHLFSSLIVDPVPDFYNLLYTPDFSYKLVVNRSFKLCNNPEDYKVNCYSDEDQSVGEFLMNFATNCDKVCPVNGKHTLGSHKLHYFARGGLIRVLRHMLTYEVQGISLIRECKDCADRQELTPFVGKILWEYSLNKFFSALVNTQALPTQAKMCRHEFFQCSVFNFRVKSVLIQVEYQPFITYDFQPKVQCNTTESMYTELIRHSQEEFFEALKLTYEGLAIECRDLLVVLTSEIQGEESQTLHNMGDSLKEEAMKQNDSVSSTLATLMEQDPFSHHFNVHSLFLSACDSKVNIEHIKSILRKLKLGWKPVSSQSRTSSMSEEQSQNGEFAKPRTYAMSIDKEDELLTSLHFTLLRTSNLTLCPGIEPFLPLKEQDSASIIAYTLNSVKYFEEVSSALPKQEVNEVIETELLRGSEDHCILKFNSFDRPGLHELSSNPELWKVYGANIHYRVKVYYPRQFHCIRLHSCGPDFLQSIAQSHDNSSQLGKKGTFKYSHDFKYILKLTEEKEFKMFLDIAPNYFRHVCKALYHSMPSLLVKTLGAFKIQVKNSLTCKTRIEYILVFENLCFNMPCPIQCYDLKGTTNHRRRAKEGDGKTKMDLNFIEDFNGLPLVLTAEAHRTLYTGVWNDTIFLAKQNIIDYSLLLVLSGDSIKLGIIDYMEQYTFEKALESKYKRYIDNDNPTITHTKLYKERFREQVLRKYFITFQ